METWQEYSRMQITQSTWGKRANDTENVKNRDNGRSVWFGDKEKKRWTHKVGKIVKRTTLFNIVQEQEGKIRKVGRDHHGTVMVEGRNINIGTMGC